ncbi:protein translocase subunit SecD, partial [Ascidiaceihabitans sp.]|nr:protein translocase subunit SecD [Ascidiaceihabitans sp.]
MLQFESWKRVLIWITCLVGLLLAVPNGFYTRVEQHNDAVAAIELGADTPENQEMAAQWPSYLPSSLVNLGLDLRGGAHLLAEVQVADVYQARMEATWPEVRDALRPLRSTVGTIRKQPSPVDELRVRIGDVAGMQLALETVRALARPVQSLTGIGAFDIAGSAVD